VIIQTTPADRPAQMPGRRSHCDLGGRRRHGPTACSGGNDGV